MMDYNLPQNLRQRILLDQNWFLDKHYLIKESIVHPPCLPSPIKYILDFLF
jgi:hypothetical protein